MKYKQVYYTIGQVSNISELPQSVLRYWETVIDALNPLKSSGGTRQYSESDIELVLKIKKLLYDDGFTIKGANKHISDAFKGTEKGTASEQIPGNDQMDSNERTENLSSVKSDSSNPQQNTIPDLNKVITELKSILKILTN
jgi:DNA-binding transcriptional MerR regulator